MLLVHVSQLHRIANLYRPAVGLLNAHNQAEQRGLAGSVRADDAHNPGRRQLERKMLEQQLVAISLGDVVELDHLIAQMRPVGDVNLQVGLLLFSVCRCQLLVSPQTRLLLGLTGFGRHPHPLQLALQSLAALGLLLFLQSQPLGLLVQPRRIVPLPGNALAAVQLQYPAGHIIQKVPVVRNGDNRSLILLQMRLQPLDTLGVQMVRGLVQKQHVGLPQKQSAQSHTTPLASGKGTHQRIGRRALKRVHRPLQLGIYFPAVHMVDLLGKLALPLDQRRHLLIGHRLHELHGNLVVLRQNVHHLLHSLLHNFQHGLGRIHLRLLFQIPHGIPRRPYYLALVGFLHPGDNLQQR